MRGLDLLESLPFVKSGAFGAIGHSLGGHNSVYTAVFDERIKVVVTSCGLDSYLDYYGGDEKVWLPEKGWTQTRYMPKLAGYRGRLEEIPFDFHEMIGALAPRHVLIIAPLKDDNFRAQSVDRIVASARPIFALYGHPERLQVEHPDCQHDFPNEMRDKSYALIDSVLLAAGNARQEKSNEKKAVPSTRWVDVRRPGRRGKGLQRHEVVLRPTAREGRGRGASLGLGAGPTTPPDCSFASRPTPRPSRPGGLSPPAALACRTCRPRASVGSTST